MEEDIVPTIDMIIGPSKNAQTSSQMRATEIFAEGLNIDSNEYQGSIERFKKLLKERVYLKSRIGKPCQREIIEGKLNLCSNDLRYAQKFPDIEDLEEGKSDVDFESTSSWNIVRIITFLVVLFGDVISFFWLFDDAIRIPLIIVSCIFVAMFYSWGGIIVFIGEVIPILFFYDTVASLFIILIPWFAIGVIARNIWRSGISERIQRTTEDASRSVVTILDKRQFYSALYPEEVGEEFYASPEKSITEMIRTQERQRVKKKKDLAQQSAQLIAQQAREFEDLSQRQKKQLEQYQNIEEQVYL